MRDFLSSPSRIRIALIGLIVCVVAAILAVITIPRCVASHTTEPNVAEAPASEQESTEEESVELAQPAKSDTIVIPTPQAPTPSTNPQADSQAQPVAVFDATKHAGVFEKIESPKPEETITHPATAPVAPEPTKPSLPSTNPQPKPEPLPTPEPEEPKDGWYKGVYYQNGEIATDQIVARDDDLVWVGPDGRVTTGITKLSDGRCVLSKQDGSLISGGGWITTSEFEGTEHRYWVDPSTLLTNAPGVVEIDGNKYLQTTHGHIHTGTSIEGDVLVVANDEGVLDDGLFSLGWIEGDGLFGSNPSVHGRYYVANGENGTRGLAVGPFSVDGIEYVALGDGKLSYGTVVAGDTVWFCDPTTGVLKDKMPVSGSGPWDHQDWDYIRRIQEQLHDATSDTDVIAVVDYDWPPRNTVFKRANNDWLPMASFWAVQGQLNPGTHKMPIRETFVGGGVKGEAGYAGSSSTSTSTDTYAQWISDNIPEGSSVVVIGNRAADRGPKESLGSTGYTSVPLGQTKHHSY